MLDGMSNLNEGGKKTKNMKKLKKKTMDKDYIHSR